MHRDLGRGLAVAAVVAAATLAGCATDTALNSPAAVRIDPQLEAQAGAFESFMRGARGIEPTFSGPADVTHALQTGAAYEPKQLEAGMVAFAAMAALQEPAFVAGVRRAAADRKGGGDLSHKLAARPADAMTLPGAAAAASRARAALFRQGSGLAEGGQKVKAASYSIQRQSWAKASVPRPSARLTRVKSISRVVYRPVGDDPARLRAAVSAPGARSGGPSPVVARGVALAALNVLGEGRSGAGLMSEPKTGMCVRLAKLNLYQCLASAGPYYEDIYCLGQHAMIEPSQCVAGAAGAPPAPPAPAKRRG